MEGPSPIESSLFAQGYSRIAGVDEAGRGPLAGPVVSAAVLCQPETIIPGVADSKKLSAGKREALFDLIQEKAAAVTVAIVNEDCIDKMNIFHATMRAMYEAVSGLELNPDYILVDGNHPIPGINPCEPVVKGDSKAQCMRAASIIAKVTRDRLMEQMHKTYPQYGFDRHKGYATRVHIAALQMYGLSPVHRRTFCRRILNRHTQLELIP